MRQDDRLFLDMASRAMQSALGLYTRAVYDEEDEADEDTMRENEADDPGYGFASGKKHQTEKAPVRIRKGRNADDENGNAG